MLEYIGNNYEDVLEICMKYTNNYNDGNDLMGVLIDNISNKKIKDIIDAEKIYYIVAMIKNLSFSNKSDYIKTYKYHKYKYNHHQFLNLEFGDGNFDVEEIDDFYKDGEIYKNEKEQIIITILNKLVNNNEINLSEKDCFLFYYMPELRINIDKMNLVDINSFVRKPSFRKLEKLTGLNYNKIRKNIIKVEILLKNEIDINFDKND